MAAIVKCRGTLTVRGDIKTKFENSGPSTPSSVSPLKATDTFLLQLGHRRGARNNAAHLGAPSSEKYVFVFLSLQTSHSSTDRAATVLEHQQGA